MKENHRLHNVYGDDLNQGLVPATEEETKLCEEKEKSIGALPVGYVKIDSPKPGAKAKYYKLVKLDPDQQEQKLKVENLRRLRKIEKHGRVQVILQSIMLGLVALSAIFLLVLIVKK